MSAITQHAGRSEGQMASEAAAIHEAMRIEHAKEKARREAEWAKNDTGQDEIAKRLHS